MRPISCLTLLLAALLATPLAVQADLYRWVDENGRVHYGDRPPIDQTKEDTKVLNKKGAVVRTIERPKTREEIERERAEREAREQQAAAARETAQQQAEKARHDQVLLRSYGNVREIEITRDDRLNTVDSLLRLLEEKQENLHLKLAELEDLKMRQERGEVSAREGIDKEIEALRQQLDNNAKAMDQRRRERQDIVDKFEIDITRFRQLKGQ
ncbi:MAG: DUF4124 domain-containing protein [Chromatiales bacterium]|jgi:hypothetical protein|nr:DUF4124 domain-containing protein [Chromatiales bacterium]MDX9768120.1 DUF4124 domain-containing protein [Ectothiorhodospiraceae bacterium]